MIPTATLTHYTLAEIAALYRVSQQTARRWLRERRIPAPVRVGRRLLFEAGQVHVHLERLRAEAAAGAGR